MCEKDVRVGSVGQRGKGSKQGVVTTGDGSSDLTTWGEPRQGHWSHTELTRLSTEEFHCLTDWKDTALHLPVWIIQIGV